MQKTAFSLLPMCAVVAAIPSPLPVAPPGLDVNDPSGSDPTSPPKSISSPTGAHSNLYPSGIPTQPDQCDGQNPSNDCFDAMGGSGGYLWFDNKSQCSDPQKSALQTAVWDATTLASYSSNFPNNGEGNRGQSSGIFYMGPDYASQQTRIAGNLKRAWQFKTSRTSKKGYITVSCNNIKNLCPNQIGGKSVGDYAWTYSGWFAYYHYITVCPVFFTINTLSKKINDVEQELASGSTRMAKNMAWLRSTGQVFLHELIHTRITDGGVEPHITDEYVAFGDSRVKAYGPEYVNSLATRPLNSGGGASRSSTNADSYAMLANAAWWWDTTGYFPGVPGKQNPSTVQDDLDDTNFTVFLYIDLDNSTDPSTENFTSLFIDNLQAFANGPPDPDDQVNSTPPSSALPPPPPVTSAPPPPLPSAADICGGWYEFLFGQFRDLWKEL